MIQPVVFTTILQQRKILVMNWWFKVILFDTTLKPFEGPQQSKFVP